MSDAMRRQSGPFRAGDRVQLTGPEGQAQHHHARGGGAFHTHTGILDHDLVIGQPDASIVTSSNGIDYLALRPLLTDFVMSMPRGAAIIYPKDAAQILGMADIFPGASVVEAGVGSGALALWLLRAIGPDGHAALVRAAGGVRRNRPGQRGGLPRRRADELDGHRRRPG